jgi:acyl-CoA thioesterase FadM
MWNAETQELAASCELTVVHMDRRERKALSFPEPVRVAVLAEISTMA